MRSVVMMDIYHRDFVAEFVLRDDNDTYTVSVAWDENDGFSVISYKNGQLTNDFATARTFGFEDEYQMAYAFSNAVAPVRSVNTDVTDKVLPKEVAQ